MLFILRLSSKAQASQQYTFPPRLMKSPVIVSRQKAHFGVMLGDSPLNVGWLVIAILTNCGQMSSCARRDRLATQ